MAGESLKQTRVPVRSDSAVKDQRIHVRMQTEDLEGRGGLTSCLLSCSCSGWKEPFYNANSYFVSDEWAFGHQSGYSAGNDQYCGLAHGIRVRGSVITNSRSWIRCFRCFKDILVNVILFSMFSGPRLVRTQRERLVPLSAVSLTDWLSSED